MAMETKANWCGCAVSSVAFPSPLDSHIIEVSRHWDTLCVYTVSYDVFHKILTGRPGHRVKNIGREAPPG